MKQIPLFLVLFQVFTLAWVLPDLTATYFCHNSTVVDYLVVSRDRAWIPNCRSKYRKASQSQSSYGHRVKERLNQLNEISDLSVFDGSVQVPIIVDEWGEKRVEVSHHEVYISEDQLWVKGVLEAAVVEQALLRPRGTPSNLWSRSISNFLAQIHRSDQKTDDRPLSVSRPEELVLYWLNRMKFNLSWQSYRLLPQKLFDLVQRGRWPEWTLLGTDDLELVELNNRIEKELRYHWTDLTGKPQTEFDLLAQKIKTHVYSQRKKNLELVVHQNLNVGLGEWSSKSPTAPDLLVEVQGKLFLSDGAKYSDLSRGGFHVKNYITAQCKWPSLKEVLDIEMMKVENKIFLKICDDDRIESKVAQSKSIEEFLKKNSDIPFMQFHIPSVQLFQRNQGGSLHQRFGPMAWSKVMGWQGSYIDKKTKSRKPLSVYEIFTRYRTSSGT